MKNIFLLLATFFLSLSSRAQNKNRYTNMSPWLVEVNLNAGVMEQQLSTSDLGNYYPRAVNKQMSMLAFADGKSTSFNGKIGYYFDKERRFGIAAGLMYCSGSGNLNMNSLHVEYMAVDFKNEVFRQVITTTQPIKEVIKFTALSVPLVAMYRYQFAKKWTFTVDAGIVYNLHNKYSYNSNAGFDYEAIYKFQQSGSGVTAVYDESPVPGEQNWLITKAHYKANNPDGNIDAYFEEQAAKGYTVGLDKSSSASGDFSYKTGSLGFILQPAVCFSLTEKLALNFGLYYRYQNFENDQNSAYQLVDNKGNLNTMMGMVQTNRTLAYGGCLGLRFYFGTKK